MSRTNGPASSEVREVLDCASPLALSEAERVGKRQRAAAVQDAIALLMAHCSIQPFVGSKTCQVFADQRGPGPGSEGMLRRYS